MNKKQYLFAAEADQIQDLLFRSSRLREVVGGSGLVSEFCRQVRSELAGGNWKLSEDQILVCDGGAFRVLFNDRAGCENFGRALADLYFTRTGGTLSVACEFPEFDASRADSFAAANQAAHLFLRQAKAKRGSTAATAHLPVVGVCASCGAGLAEGFDRLEDVPDETPNYYCKQCKSKADEVAPDRRSEFLRRFEVEVDDLLRCKPKPELIAAFDSRRYVAYLKADGNAFGELFQSCDSPDALRTLSDQLSTVMWKSLAAPARELLDTLQRTHAAKHGGSSLDHIPMLPLIVAGDECVFLLPAPWSLDFARQFCETFEDEMAGVVKDLKLGNEKPATLSAAVVICKANYPHKLAHRRAEALQAAAKRHFRQTNAHSSLINFEVVKGSSMVAGQDYQDDRYLASLQPYARKDGAGMARIDSLLDAREKLQELRRTRLNELRSLFDAPPTNTKEHDSEWHPELMRILGRIQRMETDDQPVAESSNGQTGMREKLETVLQTLAPGTQGKTTFWTKVQRDAQLVWAQGFPDLIEAWRFCERINKVETEGES